MHMKLTSDMEATCCIYTTVNKVHMYVDTQTRTPTDVLADLIVNWLGIMFEYSTSSLLISVLKLFSKKF